MLALTGGMIRSHNLSISTFPNWERNHLLKAWNRHTPGKAGLFGSVLCKGFSKPEKKYVNDDREFHPI